MHQIQTAVIRIVPFIQAEFICIVADPSAYV